MYKNQLQELAQRSCFNLPSYTCVREGPDHAPRFKAIVNFNGETFESPHYCSTLRQAEHSAAEAALNSLSSRHSVAALRILDETGVYKNLLQEIAQRVGSPLPHYTTFRSGLGHLPVFTGTVELAGITFTGEPAKNKKQAEKNAALAAWLSLKQLAQDASSSSEHENNDEQEQIRVARALQNYLLKENLEMSKYSRSFHKKISLPTPRPSSPQRPSVSTSKILPLFAQRSTNPRNRPLPIVNDRQTTLSQPKQFPAVGATPYVPISQCRAPYRGIAPPVAIRTTVPVFSAPPLPPPPTARPVQSMQPARPMRVAPPVCIRQAVPVFAAPQVKKEDRTVPALASSAVVKELIDQGVVKTDQSKITCDVDESTAVKCLEQLEI